MKHGTYDSQGVFHPQRVHLGVAMTGARGLFTGGYLAWPLSDKEFIHLMKLSWEDRRVEVEKLGFELDQPGGDGS